MDSGTSKVSSLSLKERKELELKCRNRLNWTDSGHWMGSGRAPNCFIKETLRSKTSHIITFPTDNSANKWNSEWEEAIRHGGYLASALLGLGTGLIVSKSLAFSVSALSTIVLGEAQAAIDYPKMERGWSYEIIFEYSFSWSPHPYGAKTLTQKVTGISRNHLAQEIRKDSSIKKYNLDQLPDGLGRKLAGAPPMKTSATYS